MHASYQDILGEMTRLLRHHHSYQGDPATGATLAKRCPGAGTCTCVAKPLWWDENGVPRFEPHHPRLCPDIYADQVALVQISCQGCGREFPVQMSWSASDMMRSMALSGVFGPAAKLLADAIDGWESLWRSDNNDQPPERIAEIRAAIAALKTSEPANLAEQIRGGVIHYGDPPNVECCPAGATMNCWDLRVVEFWASGFALRKIRQPENTESTMAPGEFLEWARVAELEIELPDATDTERLERV